MPVDAVLVAGPTASGKSAAAIGLADRLNGALINTDSMQVYREARILTAVMLVCAPRRPVNKNSPGLLLAAFR